MKLEKEKWESSRIVLERNNLGEVFGFIKNNNKFAKKKNFMNIFIISGVLEK